MNATESKTPTHIIPVGSHCHVASALRTIGVRKCSYPFDWITIKGNYVKGICRLLTTIINSDVESFCTSFFNRECNTIKILPYNRQLFFRNDEYDIEFPHDNLDDIVEKYQRRFQRLKDHILSQENLVLVCAFRWEEYDDELIELVELVRSYNPNTRMIAINGFSRPISNKHIQTIQFPFKYTFMDDAWTYDKTIYGPAIVWLLRDYFKIEHRIHD